MLYKLLALIILTLFLSSCNQSCKGMIKNLQKNAFNKKCSIEEATGGSISNPNSSGGGSSGGGGTIGGESYLTHVGASTIAPFGSAADSDTCHAIDVDVNGSIYCVATTQGNLGETNGGGSDIAIIKLDSSGGIDWIKQFGNTTNFGGSTSGWEYASALKYKNNSLYIGFSTTGAVVESNAGSQDVVIAKLSASDGSVDWAKQFGSTTKVNGSSSNAGFDAVSSIDVDGSGNIFFGGYTRGNFVEANALGNTLPEDAYVVKLDSSGNVLWGTQFGATTNAGGNNQGDENCRSVKVDSNGDVFCGGYTSSSMSENRSGGMDVFVMKLNGSNGALLWHKQFGQTSTFPGGSNSGVDYCFGIVVDTNNDVYCGGTTNGSMGETNGGGGDIDTMIIKINGSNGSPLWITQFGSTTNLGGSTSGSEICYGVSIDSNNNIYCAGYTKSSFGGANSGVHDTFVVKVDSSGDAGWVFQLNDSTNSSGDHSLSELTTITTADSSGNIYFAGKTDGNLLETNTSGSYDIFFGRLNSDGTLY